MIIQSKSFLSEKMSGHSTNIQSSIEELPPPPSSKTGWPWTVESDPLPPAMPDGNPWPKISIVTPSFNQGQYLEETIRSVLLQNYPNMEYIVIDGGSTDNSVEILRKYEPWLAYWVSESDKGQTHAINKGLTRATGQIIAYINSDDIYLPEALFRAVMLFSANPEINWVVGACIAGYSIEQGELKIPRIPSLPWRCLLKDYFILQPSVFLRATCIRKYGFFDESLHFSMDYDYWCRLLVTRDIPVLTNEALSFFRFHGGSKTMLSKAQFELENSSIIQKYMDAAPKRCRGLIRSEKRKSLNLYHHFTARDLRRTRGTLRALAYLFYMTLRRPSMVRPRIMWNSFKRILH